MPVQGCLPDDQGGDDRDFLRGQFQGKGMLFEDGVIRPAVRPIEFRDQL
jgi:hypothetical protein